MIMKSIYQSLLLLIAMTSVLLPTFASAATTGTSESSLENTLDQEVGKVMNFIKKSVLKNAITLAAIIGFITCAVSAAGGSVGQMALNNLGYVLFLVFGSGIMLKFIENFSL